MSYLPQDNLSYPVFIIWESGSCGSGFYVNHEEKIYLVSACHVLFNDGKLKGKTLKLYSYPKKSIQPYVIEFNIEALEQDLFRKSEEADVVVMKMGELKNDNGRRFFEFPKGTKVLEKPDVGSPITGVVSSRFRIFDDVPVGNDVVIFGYPVSVGDENTLEPTRALIRRGCVAGKNYKNRTLILDCPVYQGNSGGLALEVDEVALGSYVAHPIGVVTRFIPFEETFESKNFGYSNRSIENSGLSVVAPIDHVSSLINEFTEVVGSAE